ncbi:MAG: DUF4476 domain-containing protein [Ferruginibacter sp.]
MKKIFTLSMILLSAISSFAFSNRLTISTADDNDRIRVQVDGKNYQLSNRKSDDIVIDDLRAGYHSVKVYRVSSSNSNRGWGSGNTNNNNMKLIYNGNINVRNGYHTDISINRFGRAFVDERQIGRYDDNDDNEYNGYDWNRQPMNDRSFEQLKQTIRRESFDDNKLQVLKTAVRDQWISTAQATELVKLFSFEDNKLNAAKYCYQFATDYQNYYQVANAFGFSSSKSELMRYIDANRRTN